MDKEAKKLKVIELKQNIKTNAVMIPGTIVMVSSLLFIFAAIYEGPIYLIRIFIVVLIGIGLYKLIMNRGLEAVREQYGGVLKFD